MTKKIFALILVLTIIYTIFKIHEFTQPSPTAIPSTSTPTLASINYCKPQDLAASVTLGPAAGNIYGDFQITNSSNQMCQIVGTNYVLISYDQIRNNNIKVVHQPQTMQSIFQLKPNDSVYAKIHYPNGPQCNGPTKSVNISFSYQISPDQTVIFKNPNQNFPLQACVSADITQIDLSGFSTQSPQ